MEAEKCLEAEKLFAAAENEERLLREAASEATLPIIVKVKTRKEDLRFVPTKLSCKTGDTHLWAWGAN